MVTKERISQLVDGELGEREAAEVIAALGSQDEARDAWREYHLISDALRDTRLLSARFSRQLAARLAEEPTVIAPSAARPSRPDGARWLPLSAAASVAAAALVGWLAFAPAPEASRATPVAAQTPPAVVAAKDPVQVPLPNQAEDYLLAHQGYSPRNFLQGMAPYVRVASSGPARKP